MDFEDFLRFHNINLNYVDIPSAVRGFAYYNGCNYLVAINSKYSREQNIKTTAHELIHIFKNHFFCQKGDEEECEEEVEQIIKELKNKF